MYLWKCCVCRIPNHSDLYHCRTCAHAECEFCAPFAGPASHPNPKIPEPKRGLERFITILKRKDLDARATALSAASEQPRAQQPAEKAQEESVQRPAENPAETPAKEQLDQQVGHLAEELAEQPADPPTNQTPKNT